MHLPEQVNAVRRGGHAHLFQVVGGEARELVVGEVGDRLEVLGLVLVGFVAEVLESGLELGFDFVEGFDGFFSVGGLLVLPVLSCLVEGRCNGLGDLLGRMEGAHLDGFCGCHDCGCFVFACVLLGWGIVRYLSIRTTGQS